MFENEIKFISDFTLNKVKELGSFITVEKLLPFSALGQFGFREILNSFNNSTCSC